MAELEKTYAVFPAQTADDHITLGGKRMDYTVTAEEIPVCDDGGEAGFSGRALLPWATSITPRGA